MQEKDEGPRALFPSPDGTVYPDTLICSGVIPPQMEGRPCPFSEAGRLPLPRSKASPLNDDVRELGVAGDLTPPCAVQYLGSLRDWQGQGQVQFPEHLAPLRLFKCRQWFLFVVLGLRDDRAGKLNGGAGAQSKGLCSNGYEESRSDRH